MRASQMILKTTAAARAATIWKEVASAETGTSADSAFETSSGRTWEHLSTYFNKLASDSGQLPDRTLLDRPLEDAIAPHTIERGDDGYTPLPVFTSLAGLAVVHLIEQQGDTQSMKLPQPGVSSGNIMPWGTQALLT